jgi:divalent metal cation (Fe/Co/Zn/Cd) transporter
VRALHGHLGHTSQLARGVFGEDSAALGADVIAIAGIALHQITGSPVWDALGSIAIGLVLTGVAVFLARRNVDFLVGDHPPPAEAEILEGALLARHGVAGVDEMLVTVVGPSQLWVVARVDLDDAISGADAERLASAAETELRSLVPEIVRVDLSIRPAPS